MTKSVESTDDEARVTGPDVREIHIDAQVVPDAVLPTLARLGYVDDHFIGAGNGMQRPPYHLTWQCAGERQHVRRRFGTVWRETVAVVNESADFVGYLEAEFIASGYQVDLAPRTFDATVDFPLPVLQLEESAADKVSDLHMKVPLHALTSELDALMAARGVFYVDTPKGNRIFTIQFLSHADGRSAFHRMRDYFQRAGGATEITYEVCPVFLRRPSSLGVPAAVAPGSLISLR
jgi:hypothetical protein